MRHLPLPGRLYVGAVIILGVCVVALVFPHARFHNPLLFVVLLALSSISSVFKVRLPLSKSRSTMSVSYAVDFAALLLLGPHETALVAATSAWSQCRFRVESRTPLYRTLFSMACLVITVEAAGLVYAQLGGTYGRLQLGMLPKPLAGTATTYFLVNTLAVATAIALGARGSILRVWNENFLWSAPSYFVGAGAAAFAVMAIERLGFWPVPFAAAPVFLTYRAYKTYLGRVEDAQRHAQDMADLHLAAIEALARAIDAKDQRSRNHLRRVQTYATAVAQAVGMSETEIQGVKTAALLHDIGKLAVPEHILSKPGRLTPWEFEKIRAHPDVGAQIIEAVPFPYPVAPLIRSHHERWDGTGYPAGLKGEEIPLGARILTLVDYFDALRTDRPYHTAMPLDAAVDVLKQEAGKALDPCLVEQFLAIRPSLNAVADDGGQPASGPTSVQPPAGVARPANGFCPEVCTTNVFEDIGWAHRELYALYEIAQAMGTSLGVSDTMALICSKLSKLVPFSCCALFLPDADGHTLRCRFASGTDADILQHIAVRPGEGLNGWVASNRRPLVNARPSADLEAACLDASRSTRLRSALVCPLVFQEQLIGTLAVYHVEADFYQDDHGRLLERVAEQAAAVINNSLLFEQTKEDSLTDPLTGLANSRLLFMHLAGEMARATRLKAPLSLLVMDLDEFKAINDRHGHHSGDRVLCEVGHMLRAAIRPYDLCARYAGDEFIIVLPGCHREEAERKRLELQQAVDGTRFEVRPGRRVSLAISAGAATFPHDGESCEDLLAVADQCMYHDKATRKQHVGSRRSSHAAIDWSTSQMRALAPRGRCHRDGCRGDPALEAFSLLVGRRQTSATLLQQQRFPGAVARAWRFGAHLPVRYRMVSDTDWYSGLTEDISWSGMLFRAEQSMEAKTPLELILELPGGMDAKSASYVCCQGEVVRALPPETPELRPALAVRVTGYRLGARWQAAEELTAPSDIAVGVPGSA